MKIALESAREGPGYLLFPFRRRILGPREN